MVLTAWWFRHKAISRCCLCVMGLDAHTNWLWSQMSSGGDNLSLNYHNVVKSNTNIHDRIENINIWLFTKLQINIYFVVKKIILSHIRRTIPHSVIWLPYIQSISIAWMWPNSSHGHLINNQYVPRAQLIYKLHWPTPSFTICAAFNWLEYGTASKYSLQILGKIITTAGTLISKIGPCIHICISMSYCKKYVLATELHIFCTNSSICKSQQGLKI